jgi:hypothetical protein
MKSVPSSFRNPVPAAALSIALSAGTVSSQPGQEADSRWPGSAGHGQLAGALG